MQSGPKPWHMLVAFLVYRTWVIGGVTSQSHTPLDDYEVALNILPLLARYLLKLVFPVGLNALYEFHPIQSLFDWRLAGAVLVVVTFGLLVYRLRERLPAPYLLLWVVVPILPALYIPALAQVVFAERYLYFSTVAFAILGGWLLQTVHSSSRRMTSGADAAGGLRWLPMAVAVAILCGYAAADLRRQPVWKNELTLWSDTATKSPQSPDVQFNLGEALRSAGDQDAAYRHYQASLAVAPSYPEPRNNLALIEIDRGNFDAAREHARILLRYNPGHPNAKRILRHLDRLEQGESPPR
jgi:tetratricopeptide (TPR) repeat protein